METFNDKLQRLMRSRSRNEIVNFLFGLASDAVYERGYRNLTPGERALVSTWTLLGEVYNGGFDQYFTNASGDYAWDVCCRLDQIGAADVIPVVKKAIGRFPGGIVPEDTELRNTLLHQITAETGTELFEDLDNEFYQINGKWDDPLIERRLFEYIGQHPDSFPALQ